MSSSTAVVHGGADALFAAHFYAVLEVATSSCTLCSLSLSSQYSWEAVNQRIEVCALLQASYEHSKSWGNAEPSKILQQDLRAAKLPTGQHCVSMHQWKYPETIKYWKLSLLAPSTKETVEQESQPADWTAKMLNIVTISGYGTRFEAMSCEEYVSKRWGSIGVQVASFLTIVAEPTPTSDDDEPMAQTQVRMIRSAIKLDRIGDRISEVVAYAFPSHVCLFVQDPDDSYVREIQEIVQWMCQTLRPLSFEAENSEKLQISRPTQGIELYSQSNSKAMAFGLLPLQPLEI